MICIEALHRYLSKNRRPKAIRRAEIVLGLYEKQVLQLGFNPF